jgi:hypothetical protein
MPPTQLLSVPLPSAIGILLAAGVAVAMSVFVIVRFPDSVLVEFARAMVVPVPTSFAPLIVMVLEMVPLVAVVVLVPVVTDSPLLTWSVSVDARAFVNRASPPVIRWFVAVPVMTDTFGVLNRFTLVAVAVAAPVVSCKNEPTAIVFVAASAPPKMPPLSTRRVPTPPLVAAAVGPTQSAPDAHSRAMFVPGIDAEPAEYQKSM